MPTSPRPAPLPRASLTERRKAETQLEIARTAAALFAERGTAVTADDIARASGVALRTFYRYFRTKEEAVRPLLADGVRQWTDELAAASAGPGAPPVREVLERSARRALTPPTNQPRRPCAGPADCCGRCPAIPRCARSGTGSTTTPRRRWCRSWHG